jgi:hypothetical protein
MFVGIFVGLFLVMYLVYRYGSYYNITDMTEDELILLSHAHNHMSEHKYEGVKPFGRPLLRRTFFGYHRIFSNGIYEDFGIPEKNEPSFLSVLNDTRRVVRFKPTFVPFEMISGIYPVKLETRYRYRSNRPHKDLALQIETKDCRTALLRRGWGYQKLLKALKAGMGTEFEHFFRPDELLEGLRIEEWHSTGKSSYCITFTYGDIHKHKLVRSAPGYARNRERGLRKDEIDPRPQAALMPRWQEFVQRMKAMNH